MAQSWRLVFYCNGGHSTGSLKMGGYSGKMVLIFYLDKEKLCHRKAADFMDSMPKWLVKI